MIFKVLVRARLTIDGNMSFTKPLIVCAVHDILDVGAVMLVFTSIEHRTSKLSVLVEGLELWDERSIGESSSWLAFRVETWLMAIRTMCQITFWTNKAATR
jgi:hypothetical protein